MKTLLRIALGMMGLAAILVAISYQVIRAQDLGHTSTLASHTMAQESRPITADVVHVESDSSIDVIIRQGDTPNLVVSAEKQLLPSIHTRIEGSTLYIDRAEKTTIYIGIVYQRPITVEVTLPKLEHVTLRGNGDVGVRGFKAPKLDLELLGSGDMKVDVDVQTIQARLDGSGDFNLTVRESDAIDINADGSGQVELSGRTKTLTVSLDGSGDLDAEQLESEKVRINSHGTGEMTVNAKKAIDASLYGSGDLTVTGRPDERRVDSRGSSDVSFD